MIPPTPPGFSNMRQHIPTGEEIPECYRMNAGLSATNRILIRKQFDGDSFQNTHQRFFLFLEYVSASQAQDLRTQIFRLLYPVFLHLYVSLVELNSKRRAGSSRNPAVDNERFFHMYAQFFSVNHKEEMEKIGACKTIEELKQCDIVQSLRTRKRDVHITRNAYEQVLDYFYEFYFQTTPLLDIIFNYINVTFDEPDKPRYEPPTLPQDSVAYTIARLHHQMEQQKMSSQQQQHQEQLQQQQQQQQMVAGTMNYTPGQNLMRPPGVMQNIPSNSPTQSLTNTSPQPQQSQVFQQQQGQPSVPQPAATNQILPGTTTDRSSGTLYGGQQTPAPSATSIMMQQMNIPPLSWASVMRIKRPVLPSICCTTLYNTGDSLQSLAISNDGCIIAGGFAESSIRLWETQSFCPAEDIRYVDPKPLEGLCGPVSSLAFSKYQKNPKSQSQSQSLLAGSTDGTVRLWRVGYPSALVCYKGHAPGEPVWNIALNPEGFYFASCSRDNTARVWTTNCVVPARVLVGHTSDVTTAAFHPNGAYLATGSADNTVRLWSIADGNCVRVFSAENGGHSQQITSVEFSPTGKTLVSASIDGQICLWDIATCKLILQYSGPTGIPVTSLRFSPDSTYIASGSLDGCVRLWDVSETYLDNLRAAAASSFSSGPATVSPQSSSSALLSSDLLPLHVDGPLCEFYTKDTQIYTMEFSQRYLMVAGPSHKPSP